MKTCLTNKKGSLALEFIIVSGMIVSMAVLSLSAFSRQNNDINNQIHDSLNNAQNAYAPTP